MTVFHRILNMKYASWFRDKRNTEQVKQEILVTFSEDRDEGVAESETKKRLGNPLSRYERKKELSYEEHLLYKTALLERELIKKEAEVLA